MGKPARPIRWVIVSTFDVRVGMVKICEKHDTEYVLKYGRWRCPECLKEGYRRYNKKHREERKLWHQSSKGKISQSKYRKSQKGQEASIRDRYKILARKAVTRAVKNGILIPSVTCSECDCLTKTEAHHHRGYEKSRQLDVVWLCRYCHFSIHKHRTGMQDSKM